MTKLEEVARAMHEEVAKHEAILPWDAQQDAIKNQLILVARAAVKALRTLTPAVHEEAARTVLERWGVRRRDQQKDRILETTPALDVAIMWPAAIDAILSEKPKEPSDAR